MDDNFKEFDWYTNLNFEERRLLIALREAQAKEANQDAPLTDQPYYRPVFQKILANAVNDLSEDDLNQKILSGY